MADWIGAYEDYTVKAEEVHDLGGVTFALLLQQGRPSGSRGLAERSTQYTDIDEARAAAERLAQERG